MAWCNENLRDCEAWKAAGLRLSTASDAAARLFDAALRQYVSWIDCDQLGGIEKTCEDMLAADQRFVMGKVIALGLDLLGSGRTTRLDKQFAKDINDLHSMTENGSLDANPREMQHVRAIKQFADGHLVDACATWEAILKDHPTDLLALKFAHDSYFYLGNAAEIRDSVSRVLPHWSAGMPMYGYLQGMLSFGLEENNQYDAAEKAGKLALSINRQDCWATHAVAHVLEMQGRFDEGIRFLSGTVKDWDPCAYLACHNHWHWALYHLERGDYEVAMGIYEREVGRRVASGALLDIVDATSLLFRMKLQGMDVSSRWDPVVEICRPHLDDHILSFNDAMMTFAVSGMGKFGLVDSHRQSLKDFVRNGVGTNRDLTEKYGIPICDAIIAYDELDFAKAADLLYPIKDEIYRIGGSHAQRDVFDQLLIHSCIGSDEARHKGRASELLAARSTRKPNSPLTERLQCHFRSKHAL